MATYLIAESGAKLHKYGIELNDCFIYNLSPLGASLTAETLPEKKTIDYMSERRLNAAVL